MLSKFAHRAWQVVSKNPRTVGFVGGIPVYVGIKWTAPLREPVGPYLYINLDNYRLVEQIRTKADQLDESALELRTLIDTLYRAGQDDRIKHILVDCKYGAATESTGLAHLEELHRILRKIGDDTDTAVFTLHKDITGLRTFYLSGAARRSVLHPRGFIAAPGLTSESLFGRRMLQQNGVVVNVFKNGKYKSAPSAYTASKATREERENKQSVLDCNLRILWRDVLRMKFPPESRQEEKLESSGKKLEAVFKYVLKVPAYTLKEIVFSISRTVDSPVPSNTISFQEYMHRNTRVDQCRGFIKVSKKWINRFVGCMSHHSRRMANGYIDFDHQDASAHKPVRIPVVFVDGKISRDSSLQVVDSLRHIHEAVEAGANIPHVVVRVDSPGGEIVPTIKIADALDQLSVPYTVSFGNYAASGGYWVASGADRIFTNEMSLTGSIGVYMVRFDVSGAMKKIGVDFEFQTTGPLTELNNPLHPITPRMRKNLEEETNQAYAAFKSRVAKGRNMSLDLVETIAGGRVYTGKQAIGCKLVDEVGGLKETLDYVKQKHGIENEIIMCFPVEEIVGFADVINHALSNAFGNPMKDLASLCNLSTQMKSLFGHNSSAVAKKTFRGQPSVMLLDEQSALEMAWEQFCVDRSD